MTLGETLKSLREQQNISIEKFSELTHAGTHVIADFESDQYERITASVYGRAFVKEFAKALHTDPAPLLARFEAEYRAYVDLKTQSIPTPSAPKKFPERRTPGTPPPDLAKRAIPPQKPLPSQPSAKPTPPPKKHISPTVPQPQNSSPAKPQPVATIPPQKLPAEPTPQPAPPPPPPQPTETTFNAGSDTELGELFTPSSTTPSASPAPRVTIRDNRNRTPPSAPLPVATPAPSWHDRTPPEDFSHPTESVFLPSDPSPRPFVNLSAIFTRSKAFFATLPTKKITIGAGVILVLLGLSFLLPSRSSSPTQNSPLTPDSIQSSPTPLPTTEEPDQPVILFSGSALTDNLLPPPDCYATDIR